jgi:carbamoyl-phosphate synthase small subunit
VVLYDFGVKFNIIRSLKARGLEVLVVPAATPAADVLALNPDGIVFSNGPGDPAAVTYGIDNVRQCLGQKPLFGICLGHQLMGLALGGQTFKLKFGHRGGNQPVKNRLTGRVEITSQNHGFAVDLASIPDPGGTDPRQLKRQHPGGPAPPKNRRLLGAIPPRGLPRPP